MNMKGMANMTNMREKALPLTSYKKWGFLILTTAVLTISACGKQDESQPMEGSALEFDSETSEAEAAAEIKAANAPMISDREESPVLPSNNEPEGTGAVLGTQSEPDKDITGGVGGTANPAPLDNQAAAIDKSDALASTDDGLDNSAVLDNRDPEGNVSTN